MSIATCPGRIWQLPLLHTLPAERYPDVMIGDLATEFKSEGAHSKINLHIREATCQMRACKVSAAPRLVSEQVQVPLQKGPLGLLHLKVAR